MKTYSELITLKSFQERLEYLRLYSSNPSNKNRELMNKFYKSDGWKIIRKQIIQRDLGCDLGIDGFYIENSMIIHHINPVTEEDVINGSPKLTDPENLITVSYDTHNKIHYLSDEEPVFIERKPGDTKLW